MYNIANHKYKEYLPLNTVNKIRNILSELGVLMVETWTNSVEGIYSVRIDIQGTNVGQNGKGTTEAYALASAYAEFMERLQNSYTYNEVDLCPEAVQGGGFYFGPDEKYLTVEDVLQGDDELFKVLIPLEFENNESEVVENTWKNNILKWLPEAKSARRHELACKWSVGNPEGCPSDFIALPFYNVTLGKLCFVPYQMQRMPYASNGTCAGNSPEEAIVQGLSEIMERYVIKLIFTKRITPPTVPPKHLHKYPDQYSLIEEIEHSGPFRVIVKDCSLGEGLPVIGVVFINEDNHSYIVRFGSHPSFSIALERCLTEFLQGRDIKNLSGMTRFYYDDEKVDQHENYISIMTKGEGSYPVELFSPNFTYQFEEFKDVNGYNNKQLLHYLTDLLQGKGCQILIRDVSYLGFPSYHIIVPGFSELRIVDEKRLGIEKLRVEVRKIMRNLNEASVEELHKIVACIIRSKGYNEGENISYLLGFPVNVSFPWLQIPNYVFISAALYKMNKLGEAHGMMRQSVEALTQQMNYQKQKDDAATVEYYSCVRDLLGAKVEGVNEKKIAIILKTFYADNVVQGVYAKWDNHHQIFANYGVLNCWDCQSCTFRSSCSQELIKELHLKLKKLQAQNPIDQRQIQDIFSI